MKPIRLIPCGTCGKFHPSDWTGGCDACASFPTADVKDAFPPGLYEVTATFENPNADRRVKTDIFHAPWILAGTRLRVETTYPAGWRLTHVAGHWFEGLHSGVFTARAADPETGRPKLHALMWALAVRLQPVRIETSLDLRAELGVSSGDVIRVFDHLVSAGRVTLGEARALLTAARDCLPPFDHLDEDDPRYATALDNADSAAPLDNPGANV